MADDQDGRGRSPPTFTTLPIRACSDKRLTGTDLRVLGVIGFHDRRSIARGAGAGCFAGQRLIAQRAGLDRKNVRQSIERLVTLGYLERTERASEKGGYVLRVIEVDPSAPAEPIGGAGTPYADDDDDFHSFEQGVQEPPHRGLGNPLNRDIRDLAKARRDSPEGAHFSQSASAPEEVHGETVCAKTDAHRTKLKFSTLFAANVLGSQHALAMRSGVQKAYISRARNGLSIPEKAATDLLATCEEIFAESRLHCPTLSFGDFGYYLPADFTDKEVPTQLALLEKALKEAAGTPDYDRAKQSICDFLAEIYETEDEGECRQRALRMESEVSYGAYD